MSENTNAVTETTDAEVVSLSGSSTTTDAARFISGLRTAAKAKTDPKGKVVALLEGASRILGAPEDAAKDVMQGEALISQGRDLLVRSEDNLRRWTIVAQVSREAGVSARTFATITGGNKNSLSRFAGAADIFDAARENKTPVSIGQAMVQANKASVATVQALVTAYREAPEGVEPGTDVSTVAAKAAPKPPTVESFVSRVESLASLLSTLLEGGYAAPKAETLLALETSEASLRKAAEQTAVLRAQIAKASRTPKARAAKAA